jgi:hypothetical protein
MDAAPEPIAPPDAPEPAGVPGFARIPPRQKAAVLRACIPRILAAAPEMVAASCARVGLATVHPLAGGAWLAGPVALLANARRYAEALEQIASEGRPHLPARDLRARWDGRVVAKLGPQSIAERGLYLDGEAFAVFDADVAPEDVIAGQGLAHRGAAPEAPPVTVSDPLDALRALLVDDARVTLEGSDEILARALAPLTEAGWLTLTPADGTERWAPPRTYSTAIVVPVLYARDELAFLAKSLAGEIATGAAFGLPAPQRILVSGCWAQRTMFVDALGEAFAAFPAEMPSRTLTLHPEGTLDPKAVLVEDRVAVVDVGCDEPVGMIAAAVAHADRASAPMIEILLQEVLAEERHIAHAIERAIVTSQARVISVNEHPAMLGLRGDAPGGPWMLTRVSKGVVYGPLWPRRLPVYVPHADAPALGARLAAFYAGPRIAALARIVPRMS